MLISKMTSKGPLDQAEDETKANLICLKEAALDNLEHFKSDSSEAGKKIHESLLVMVENVEPLDPLIDYIRSRAKDFDFEDVQANGYRSFLRLVDIIVAKAKVVVTDLSQSRDSYFFRKESFLSKVYSYSEAIRSMYVFLRHCETLMTWTEPGMLLPMQHSVKDLLHTQPTFINQYPFYGRCLGLQFCDSVATIFKTLLILMASFSEMYYSNGKIISPIIRSSKYLIDPELRAKRIVNISQYASAYFCKSFWLLGEMELMLRIPRIVNSGLAINKVIILEPVPLIIDNTDGVAIDIPIPSAHNGPSSFPVRLISASNRLGISDDPPSSVKFPSDELIFHCHGGGFIAQSSGSHETYLRQWALDIDTPILSVDYSLSPEAPYPRALEEIFYAYCWALKNLESLGTTGQRIVVAGDSAGGNLVLGITLKCIQYGVRKPDGVFVAYVPTVIKFAPSASRLLCLIDPLLPFGFLMGCIKAYTLNQEDFQNSLRHEWKLKRMCVPSETPKKNGVHSPTTDPEESPDSPTESPRLDLNDLQSDPGFWSRLVHSVSQKFKWRSNSAEDEKLMEEEILKETYAPCPDDMMDFTVPENPLLSPFLVPDDVLRKYPPVSLLSTEFDPFLDDCIDFAKRLKQVGNNTKLTVVPSLCHGFLNFALMSKEATEASKVCIESIKELLRADHNAEECV